MRRAAALILHLLRRAAALCYNRLEDARTTRLRSSSRWAPTHQHQHIRIPASDWRHDALHLRYIRSKILTGKVERAAAGMVGGRSGQPPRHSPTNRKKKSTTFMSRLNLWAILGALIGVALLQFWLAGIANQNVLSSSISWVSDDSHQQTSSRTHAQPPTPSPRILTGPNLNITVTSSSTANHLGRASVVLNSSSDSPSDRWQAATTKQNWIKLKFDPKIEVAQAITSIVLDWEAAHCEDYTIKLMGDIKNDGGEWWRIVYNGSDARDRQSLLSVTEKETNGHDGDPGNENPVHIVHAIGPLPNEDPAGTGRMTVREVEITMKRPATQWAVSLWQIQLYGY